MPGRILRQLACGGHFEKSQSPRGGGMQRADRQRGVWGTRDGEAERVPVCAVPGILGENSTICLLKKMEKADKEAQKEKLLKQVENLKQKENQRRKLEKEKNTTLALLSYSGISQSRSYGEMPCLIGFTRILCCLEFV